MLSNKKKIYVTGGTGLVGRNIIENKKFTQHEIIAPTHAQLDLLDYNAVFDFIKQTQPDIIIHTAGKVGGIQANMSDPYGFFTNNIVMGLNVVRAAKENEIQYVLNLSSSCSYPCEAKNPLHEDMIFDGKFEITNEGYAIAKTAILRMCEYITNQFEGFYYKTLIPCNLYGRYDKFSPQNSHLIPAIIRKIHEAKLNNIKTIDIWGDGESRREFMYAGDFANIAAEIINNFDKIPTSLNIGLGYDYSINEYYEAVAKAIDYDVEFIHDLTKPSGMKQKLLDISKQISLGIKSGYTLEDGIKQTYEYYLNEYKGE